MKYFTRLMVLFISISAYSQTYNDIMNYSSYMDKSIKSPLSKFTVKPTIKKEKFGVESLAYKMANHVVAFTEDNSDNGLISDIMVFNNKGINAENVWYNIVSELSKNNSYSEVSTLFNDKNKNFKNTDMKIPEIIKLLRSLPETNNIDCAVVYKKDNNYYGLFLVDDGFIFNARKTPFTL